MKPEILDGDLLSQDVDVIVNAWNRNIIPWWLLLPQGVSGAIKKKAGYAPFREVAKHGPIPLGGAAMTGAGRLPYRAIIHVAGISMFWVASERSIKGSVISAMRIVDEQGFKSVAFPIIGGGTGGAAQNVALAHMLDAFTSCSSPARAVIVRYQPTSAR